MAFECVLKAWEDHQSELRRYLVSRLPDPAMADDFLQDVFCRAMRAGQTFCELDNPRAWLFRVARNALTDNIRLRKQWVSVPDHLPDERRDDREPVDELDQCIQRTLPVLADMDRDILEACDLGGMSQVAYAEAHGLSLTATKARIRRARERLRVALASRCKVETDSSGRICGHKMQS